jgi:hypothetical protein
MWAYGSPPPVLAAPICQHRQQIPRLIRYAVLTCQRAQIEGADPALPGLDPADLGPVTLEDPGGVVQAEAGVSPVLTQGRAHQVPT